MNKLKELLNRCKCGVIITVNEHRDYYQTVETALEEVYACDPSLSKDIPPEVKGKMIELDTIVNIHFYPDTPIGFYNIYHYDIDLAIDDALSCFDS